MVYTFPLVLLWPFSRRGPPPPPPRPATTSIRCFQRCYLVRVLSPVVPLPHLTYVLLVTHTQPHSLTTLTHSPPPTHVPPAALVLSMTMLIMHRHVRIALFHFPFVLLARASSLCFDRAR